jgi:hypothetical protein
MHRRALAEHTYAQRAAEVDEILRAARGACEKERAVA